MLFHLLDRNNPVRVQVDSRNLSAGVLICFSRAHEDIRRVRTLRWNNGLENIVWREAVVTNCIFSFKFRSILVFTLTRQRESICLHLYAMVVAGNCDPCDEGMSPVPRLLPPPDIRSRSSQRAGRPVPWERKTAASAGSGSMHKRRSRERAG